MLGAYKCSNLLSILTIPDDTGSKLCRIAVDRMTKIPPWSPYLEPAPIASAGRTPLLTAFGNVVRAQHDFHPHELPEIFAAPEDEGENDACRYMVTLDAALLAAQFVRGRIATFARPLGGGEVVAIEASAWEIDDPLPRMATGAFNLERWADPEAQLTHRIFVDTAGFDEWLAALKPVGPLSAREIEEVIDPQLRAARAVAAKRVRQQPGARASFGGEITAPPAAHPAGLGPELLTLTEVSDLIRKGRSSIYAMIAEGQFPEPIKLGSNSRWDKHEVKAWIEEQAARRGREES